MCKHKTSQNQGCATLTGNGFSNILGLLESNCAKNTNWSQECLSMSSIFFNSEKDASATWEGEPASAVQSVKDENGQHAWKARNNIGLDFVSGQDGKLYHALCVTFYATTSTTTTTTTTTSSTTPPPATTATAEMSSAEVMSELNHKECITATTTTTMVSENEGERSSVPHIDLFLNPGR